MENKENVRGITASVRFQDAEIIKEGRALSFLRDLEDSKSFVGNENEGTTNASNTTNDRVDVPDRMTQNYGINSVRNDLHRFSVHVNTACPFLVFHHRSFSFSRNRDKTAKKKPSRPVCVSQFRASAHHHEAPNYDDAFDTHYSPVMNRSDNN